MRPPSAEESGCEQPRDRAANRQRNSSENHPPAHREIGQPAAFTGRIAEPRSRREPPQRHCCDKDSRAEDESESKSPLRSLHEEQISECQLRDGMLSFSTIPRFSLAKGDAAGVAAPSEKGAVDQNQSGRRIGPSELRITLAACGPLCNS
jgi:hypothetical protein